MSALRRKALVKSASKNRQVDSEVKADDEIDLDEALKMSVRSDGSGSAKNSTRQNRIYQQIKRDIEIRERNKPTQECADQVYFVDKQRNAAVVIGDQDLKSAVKDKKKRDRQKGEEEECDEPDHETYISQALYELRCGSAEIALEYMNNALRVEQEDDTIYIIRSQCLSKLGRAAEAIQDAEVALSSDRTNTKALLAKGEALYIEGQFELALVQFERGLKIKRDQALKNGIIKCREAILFTLGKSKKIDEHIVKLITNDENLAQRINKKSLPRISKETKLKATTVRVMKDRSTKKLGKLNEDVQFLENFLKKQTWRQKQDNAEGFVNNTATDALKFLQDRKHFWEQTIVTETT